MHVTIHLFISLENTSANKGNAEKTLIVAIMHNAFNGMIFWKMNNYALQRWKRFLRIFIYISSKHCSDGFVLHNNIIGLHMYHSDSCVSSETRYIRVFFFKNTRILPRIINITVEIF